MRNVALFAAGVTALALSSTASATPPTVESVQKFGLCATGKYEGAELLATQPGSAEEKEVLAEFGRRGCGTLDVNAGVLRGSVAEQLFKADFGSIGARPRRDLIEIFTVSTDELAELDENARKRIDYVAFGTCVAASNPEGSTRLLGTPVESPQEKAVLTEMVGNFSSCLAQGERFNFSRADLRGALAEGSYRLALSQSLDEEVVVTGTRDPSKSVACKLQDVAGTRIRRNVCLTEAQWAERSRTTEYGAEAIKRTSMETQEILTTIETRTRFSSGS